MRLKPFGTVVTLILLLFVASTAHAQEFGRNKVQFKNFKFEVLKTEHFDIYFYPEERAASERTSRMAERWYSRLSQVFNHQMHMTNLLARMSWEARAATGRADAGALIDAVARDVVDYMLFVEEAPLSAPLEGSSGFTEWFSAQGPRDSRGRSLRQLDLTQRLLRYPCSYMIYTDAFDGLPDPARAARA